MHKKYTESVAKGIIVLSIVILPIATFAQNIPNEQGQGHKASVGERAHGKKGNKGTVGTVTAISGTTLTITSKEGIVYTVDVANAKFPQKPIAQTISTIVIGDKVSVVGTLANNTITAKRITDISHFERTVFAGKVTAVSGSMITVIDLKKVTSTIDATNATIVKNHPQVAGVITDIKVGDMILSIGTKTGTTIVATKIIDKGGLFHHAMNGMKGHHKPN